VRKAPFADGRCNGVTRGAHGELRYPSGASRRGNGEWRYPHGEERHPNGEWRNPRFAVRTLFWHARRWNILVRRFLVHVASVARPVRLFKKLSLSSNALVRSSTILVHSFNKSVRSSNKHVRRLLFHVTRCAAAAWDAVFAGIGVSRRNPREFADAPRVPAGRRTRRGATRGSIGGTMERKVGARKIF
jgi:hypothetical protein